MQNEIKTVDWKKNENENSRKNKKEIKEELEMKTWRNWDIFYGMHSGKLMEVAGFESD